MIAVSVLAGIVVPASSALASPGGIGIRLVDSGSARDDPLARSYIVDRVAPGATIRRTIEITNSTRSTADVAVYPAAAVLRHGTFQFAPGHGRNELSSWTSVSRGALRLEPGSEALETITVDVPKDASAGMRYAVIWAAVSAPGQAAGGVTLVNRVGVRMYITIGPGGLTPSFAVGTLQPGRSATGEPVVVAEIRNDGRRTLDVSGTLQLSEGPAGLRAGPFAAKLGTPLAPGDSERLTVRLDRRLPEGPWRVRMQLRAGAVQRTAVATIRFPSRGGPVTQPTARAERASPRHLTLVAVAALTFLVLVLSGGTLWQLRVRRRRAGPV